MQYLITEAVALKVAREDRDAHEEAQKQQEMKTLKEEAKERLKHLFPAHGR